VILVKLVLVFTRTALSCSVTLDLCFGLSLLWLSEGLDLLNNFPIVVGFTSTYYRKTGINTSVDCKGMYLIDMDRCQWKPYPINVKWVSLMFYRLTRHLTGCLLQSKKRIELSVFIRYDSSLRRIGRIGDLKRMFYVIFSPIISNFFLYRNIISSIINN